MPKLSQPNYPDILGYITGGQRIQVGVIDTALAMRPAIVRAGDVVEAILLLQNTTDVRVEVIVEPKVPARDGKGRPGCFVAKTTRMTAVLAPAEVGYVSLPIQTLLVTASGQDYKIEMSINVKPQAKARVVRQSDSIPNLGYYFFLEEATLLQVAELKGLSFSVNKAGLLGTSIDASFHLGAPSGAPEQSDLKPSWQRLWAMSDNTDTRHLFELHHDSLRQHVIPALRREYLYRPLYRSTRRRFKGRGYRLIPTEAHYITKLLVNVLEMGRQLPDPLFYPDQAMYGVSQLLEAGWPSDGRPVPLPGWCRSALTRIASDERIINQPVKSLAFTLYDDVLRDAIVHGFGLVHQVIGRELGTRDQSQRYAEKFIQTLQTKETDLVFEDMYLPLILGGIIVDTDVSLRYENPLERLHETYDHVRKQRPKATDVEAMVVYSIACKVCDWALAKHGYRL
ncbi:MAG: hypothetical protein K8J31_04740 [Anaerolineae bacterium]|nr:hypothetical protein [Anaerolineae bacterium]